MLVQVHNMIVKGSSPFKYYKMWSSDPDFQRRVQSAWDINVRKSAIFRVVQKLKRLNKERFGEIRVADVKAYSHLIDNQLNMHKHDKEMACERDSMNVAKYRKIHNQYISCLQQKVQFAWL